MILGIALGGTALILFAAMLVPARYTATAEIVLIPQSDAAAAPQLSEQVILTKLTELSADALLRRAADNLSRDPRFQAAEGQVANEARTSGDFVRRMVDRILPARLSPWHAVKGCRRLRVAELRRHLKAEQEAGSHVIAVNYTSTDPDVAALIANRVTALYLKSQTEERQAAANRALVWLDKRVPQAKSQLETVESEIETYRTVHGLADVNPTAATDQQFAEITRQLAAAESALAADRSRVAALRGSHGAGVLSDTISTPGLAALRAREASLLQSEASLGVSLGENHPEMRQIRSALHEIRGKIAQENARAAAGLREQTRVQASEVQTLRRRLATVEDASSDMRLGELNRQVTADRQLYDDLLRRQEAMLEQRQTASSGFEVVSHAVPPERPSSPDPLLFGPPALVFLLACGSLAAVGMDRLDPTLKSEAQVSEALGIPSIGFVPRLRKIKRERPHQSLLRDNLGPYVEAIRSIVATSLLAAVNRPQLVLVTSSVPGEGKTTLAVSFATYAARLGRRTILLDLDFRHPATAREFGRMANERILERLLQDRPVGETVQHIAKLHLDYVPMGNGTGDPLRLFAGNQIERLMTRLRAQYDCIVVDSAPLLAITETRILAAMADQVLFAVKWDSTDRRVARNALDLLRRAGVRTDPEYGAVAAVLTQIDLRKHTRSRDGSTAEAMVHYGQYYDHSVGAGE